MPVWGEQQDYESGWITFPPDHGFVFGCVWGAPYQIQYLDLRRVEEGLIQREERDGFIDLPSSVFLRNAVDVDYDAGKVAIAIGTVWDLQKGDWSRHRFAAYMESRPGQMRTHPVTSQERPFRIRKDGYHRLDKTANHATMRLRDRR